jgi:hypothetical protein
VSSKQTNKNSVRNENKKIWFVSFCFETIETNRNVSKQTKKTLNFFIKIPKYALYQTVPVGLLFVSVQSKHRNSLFRYRSETNETNQNKAKNPRKTLNFLKKYPNMLHIKLFPLVFSLFRFNRNIENFSFGIEAKQPKQTFCFG